MMVHPIRCQLKFHVHASLTPHHPCADPAMLALTPPPQVDSQGTDMIHTIAAAHVNDNASFVVLGTEGGLQVRDPAAWWEHVFF